MPIVDYLVKDPIIPDNQNFCCMSLWMNENKRNVKAIRVSGSFKTIEEAQEQIQLIAEPGHYNFAAEVGAWNAFDPLPNKNNLNDELNTIMERYLLSLKIKNFEFEKRKHNMIVKNIRENSSIKEEEMNKLEDEIKELTSEREIKQKRDQIEKIKETLKSFKEKIEDHEKKEQENDEKLKNIQNNLVEEYTQTEVENQNVPIKFEGQVKRTTEKLEKQNWYCVSFLVEDKKSLVGIKISGCFDTEELANDHSRALRDINDSFSILVGELYKWQPFNPEPDSELAGESEYADNQLNETMKKKKENEKKAQLYHEYRKFELINKNLDDSLNNKLSEKEEMKKKLENTKTEDSKKTVEQEILELESQIEKLENKKKEISEKESELSEKIGLQELQKKLQMKNNSIDL
jgi:chromosome segregation ATPase